jgi:hypothetical protein
MLTYKTKNNCDSLVDGSMVMVCSGVEIIQSNYNAQIA